MKIDFEFINSEHVDEINQIANWYLNEWGVPNKNTFNHLTKNPDDNVIFQIMLTVDNICAGTGGLYKKVRIQDYIKKYNNYYPWIALMYTTPNHRGKGFGARLLDEIESEAKKKGFRKLYLFTSTAETLYRRKGWDEIDRFIIKGKVVVIMSKKI